MMKLQFHPRILKLVTLLIVNRDIETHRIFQNKNTSDLINTEFLQNKYVWDQTYFKFIYPRILLVQYYKVTVSFKKIKISHILFTQIVNRDIVNNNSHT